MVRISVKEALTYEEIDTKNKDLVKTSSQEMQYVPTTRYVLKVPSKYVHISDSALFSHCTK